MTTDYITSFEGTFESGGPHANGGRFGLCRFAQGIEVNLYKSAAEDLTVSRNQWPTDLKSELWRQM